jgi:hypothetical protein
LTLLPFTLVVWASGSDRWAKTGVGTKRFE